jgi:protein-S-isoprenylcysteine O-methyltransferase Ste14
VILRWALPTGAIGGVLFLAGGRVDVAAFWAYLLVRSLVMLASFVAAPDRSLARERRRPGPGAIDGWLRHAAVVLVGGHFVIAGLSVRYGWPAVPAAGTVVALFFYTVGLALSFWAMATNRFFSSVVRLQDDRAQEVVTTGPYRVVRHPGNLGMIVALLASGPALGSWWATLPVSAYATLVVYRTVREDALLTSALPGYAQYALAVPYRLVPRVW